MSIDIYNEKLSNALALLKEVKVNNRYTAPLSFASGQLNYVLAQGMLMAPLEAKALVIEEKKLHFLHPPLPPVFDFVYAKKHATTKGTTVQLDIHYAGKIGEKPDVQIPIHDVKRMYFAHAAVAHLGFLHNHNAYYLFCRGFIHDVKNNILLPSHDLLRVRHYASCSVLDGVVAKATPLEMYVFSNLEVPAIPEGVFERALATQYVLDNSRRAHFISEKNIIPFVERRMKKAYQTSQTDAFTQAAAAHKRMETKLVSLYGLATKQGLPENVHSL